MDKQRKQELAELKPTAEMMNEEQFWAIVQKAVDEAGDDEDEYLEVVMHELSKLSLKEMVGFRLRTDKLLYDSYTSEMWCAGYLMNGGCSDDGFEYFRLWVISRGRKVYEAALANPDNLIDYIAEDAEVDFLSSNCSGTWLLMLSKRLQKPTYTTISTMITLLQGKEIIPISSLIGMKKTLSR